jgi:starch-binding outer membrane protein, SusD/RagB family
MKYIWHLSILLALMLIMDSCSDEFLELNPIAKSSEETFYESFEDLDLTATAAYGILCSKRVDQEHLIGFGSIPSDDAEAGGDFFGDYLLWSHFDMFTHTSDEGDQKLYGYWYKGIRFANEFLEKLPSVLEKDDKVDSELVAQRVAEMKYLRAWYHFSIAKVFGGIVIADLTIDPSLFDTPRNSMAEVLHFCQTDLEEAIPDLKKKSEIGAEIGRATKGAAQALMSKVLLYESSYAQNYPGDSRFAGCEEKWDEALTHAENMILSEEYQLVGINGERYNSWRDPVNGVDGFRWIFTVDGDNSPESVWETQNVADGKGWMLSRGSYLTVMSTVRWYNYYNNSGDLIVRPTGGWSFNLPTKYLMDAFGNQDSRETGLNAAAVEPSLDPRYMTTIGLEGDTILVNDPTQGAAWYEMNLNNLPTGAIGRKYECSPEEYWDNKTNENEGPMNARYIRYADVVLMAAEAAYNSGDAPKALIYVNLVRTRARMCGFTGYPEDLSVVSMEDIIHERRLELAMEGHRFYDLVRWGLAKKYIDGTELASVGDGFKVSFIEGKHEFWPLPAQEMQRNRALEQYDGWK